MDGAVRSYWGMQDIENCQSHFLSWIHLRINAGLSHVSCGVLKSRFCGGELSIVIGPSWRCPRLRFSGLFTGGGAPIRGIAPISKQVGKRS